MFALAEDARVGLATLADVADNGSTPAGIAMLIVSIPFAFFGLIMLAVALWRSRGAVVLIGAFILFDFRPPHGAPSATRSRLLGDCWIAAAVILAGRQAPEAGAVAAPSAG